MIERAKSRLELLISCLGLAVLAFWTAPGNLISDTKIDLAVNPFGFLMRAADLWDAQFFGQLQNQAAGYFFPMGPFFALGDLIGLPPWITQRLWITLLLCAGFLGVVKVAERLGIGTPVTRVVGGLAFVLTPRVLAIAGQISSEWEATAFLPWILLPLIGAERRLRAALLSAVAVSLCGGVNAAAVLGGLAVPAIYLVVYKSWRQLAWWIPLVALATLWWTVPLVLMARYGFSFLPYTETSAVTTLVTSVPNTLFGTSDWVAYTSAGTAGFALANEAPLVIAAAMVAAIGLAGAIRRDLPVRGFVLASLVLGVAIIAAGHISVIEAPFAGAVRDLIDGPLAPLRNLRKFDGMVRLPLVLGLTHVLANVRLARARTAVTVIAMMSIAAIALPALTTGLARPGAFPYVPGYWSQAARWLNANAGETGGGKSTGVLAVPSARFGEFTWGRPMDNPLQALLNVRWASRELVPYGSAGIVRLFDAIDERLTAGRPSPGLSAVLARMGVRYILARNDLERSELRGAWPARVQTALAESPGINRVRAFGPVVGDVEGDDATLSVDQPYRALEIYEVSAGPAGPVELLSAEDSLDFTGGPEGLLDLADAGLLKGRPVLLGEDKNEGGGDRPSPEAAPTRLQSPSSRSSTVVSDSLRLRHRNFGFLRRSASPTLTASGDARDILEPGWERDATLADYVGLAGVEASSSGADPEEFVPESGFLPFAAADGDPGTFWKAGDSDRSPWVRLDFRNEMEIPEISVRFPPRMSPGKVTIETDAGRVTREVSETTEYQQLRIPEGQTGWLRIRSASAISDIGVPGVSGGRTLRLPAEGDTYMMSRRGEAASPCMEGSRRWVCTPFLEARGEEGNAFDRTITLSDAGPKRELSGLAVLRDPSLADRYMRLGSAPPKVTGSSTRVDQPVAAPPAAFDGDNRTTWVPARGDREPVLEISWSVRKRIDGIQVTRPGGARTSRQVVIEGDGQKLRGGAVGDDGEIRFRPMKTKSLKLRFDGPVQVSEIAVPGVRPRVPGDEERLHLKCGLGPQISVNGFAVPTRVSGTFGDLRKGRPLRYSACDRIGLGRGDNRFYASPQDPYRIESLVVKTPAGHGSTPPSRTGSVQAGRWSQRSRAVQVSAERDSYLAMGENFNRGWRATIGKTTLRPVKLDGWRQAWLIPAGVQGTVRMDFEPDRPYKIGVYGGLAALGLIILLALGLGLLSRSSGSPGRVAPGREGGRHGLRAGLSFTASALLGLWLAGLPGLAAGIIGSLVLLWARRRILAGRGHPGAAADVLGSPWLPPALLVTAAGGVVTGRYLRDAAYDPFIIETFADSGPQLLGILVISAVLAHWWRPPLPFGAERTGGGS